MKIIDCTSDVTEVTQVKKASYLGDYVIRILFSDGFEKAIDFKYFLKRASHPTIRQYLNEEKLKNFKIIHGNINWNNYEMIFPIDDLYNGAIK